MPSKSVTKSRPDGRLTYCLDIFDADHLEKTGSLPGELAVDNRHASQATLAEVDRQGISFLAPCRRSRKTAAALRARPEAGWRRIRLANIGRRFRAPQIIDEIIRLPQKPCENRQITIAGPGHDDSVPLMIEQMRARRIIIENGIIYKSAIFLLTPARRAYPRAP